MFPLEVCEPGDSARNGAKKNSWSGVVKRPTQVAVLAVFALKAIVVDEDMKGLAGEVADAAPVTKEARPSEEGKERAPADVQHGQKGRHCNVRCGMVISALSWISSCHLLHFSLAGTWVQEQQL